MFSKNQHEKAAGSTVIGQECLIKGSLTATGLTRVDGRIEGDLKVDGDLVVGETADIKANITGKKVTIAGNVTGDVIAYDSLELSATARLKGNITTLSLRVVSGAVFIGTSTVFEQGMAEAAAAKE